MSACEKKKFMEMQRLELLAKKFSYTHFVQ